MSQRRISTDNYKGTTPKTESKHHTKSLCLLCRAFGSEVYIWCCKVLSFYETLGNWSCTIPENRLSNLEARRLDSFYINKIAWPNCGSFIPNASIHCLIFPFRPYPGFSRFVGNHADPLCCRSCIYDFRGGVTCSLSQTTGVTAERYKELNHCYLSWFTRSDF